MKVLRIKKEDTILAVIDFQEKLLPAMEGYRALAKSACRLLRGCSALGVPILLTEQYPAGLGPSVSEIRSVLKGIEYRTFEKTSFSAMGCSGFREALSQSGRKTVVLTGIEAHICVQQTALDLIEEGYSVFLASDCIGSRNKTDKKYACRRMSEAGAANVTYEAVLFELLGDAKMPEFKQISAIVKE